MLNTVFQTVWCGQLLFIKNQYSSMLMWKTPWQLLKNVNCNNLQTIYIDADLTQRERLKDAKSNQHNSRIGKKNHNLEKQQSIRNRKCWVKMTQICDRGNQNGSDWFTDKCYMGKFSETLTQSPAIKHKYHILDNK